MTAARRVVTYLALVALILTIEVAGAAKASAADEHAASAAAPVCGAPTPESARCHAWVQIDNAGKPQASGTPSGYSPVQLTNAYGLASPLGTTWTWNNKTIAIVDAYNDPNAESDLAVYRSQFGLPACTTANGCFRKVDQNGGSSYPGTNAGWALEISLDLDMASAICPSCKILLVEASSNSFANLGTAVDTAATMGANVISNSYGGSEFSGETGSLYDGHFIHPGVAITVSSGDSGYGVEYPAASQYVTAVGGTTLKTASNTRGWTETAWSGAGSGCSAYEPKPSWQTNATNCAKRAVADVSAVADPNTGVAVYDSVRYQGRSGWFVVGGTSASSPIIAGVYALSGNFAGASVPWGSSASNFNDVTSGSNGSCGTATSSTYVLCNAGSGWDGPTGLGTPKGAGGF